MTKMSAEVSSVGLYIHLIIDGDETVSVYHDLPASCPPNTRPESALCQPAYPHLALPLEATSPRQQHLGDVDRKRKVFEIQN